MIIDITGTNLIPGNMGHDCLGNGKHPDFECCCDECDYLICCIDKYYPQKCMNCPNKICPRYL